MVTGIAGRNAHGLSRRTAHTGLMIAAFAVPETFASSLTPRSWSDQGIITGLGTTLNYLLTYRRRMPSRRPPRPRAPPAVFGPLHPPHGNERPRRRTQRSTSPVPFRPTSPSPERAASRR
jgi:hypothetical protein